MWVVWVINACWVLLIVIPTTAHFIELNYLRRKHKHGKNKFQDSEKQ